MHAVARFCVRGCWGEEMSSLQTLKTYDLNTENSHSKESKSLEKQVFHSSGNGNENVTVASAGHSQASHVHTVCYHECLNSHINVPSKYRQCVVCGKSVQMLNLHTKMHANKKTVGAFCLWPAVYS
jgi:hypothetical protein